MPAKDIYHEAVKLALIKDGWTVTDDPLYVPWAGRDLFVDFGAENFCLLRKMDVKLRLK